MSQLFPSCGVKFTKESFQKKFILSTVFVEFLDIKVIPGSNVG